MLQKVRPVKNRENISVKIVDRVTKAMLSMRRVQQIYTFLYTILVTRLSYEERLGRLSLYKVQKNHIELCKFTRELIRLECFQAYAVEPMFTISIGTQATCRKEL